MIGYSVKATEMPEFLEKSQQTINQQKELLREKTEDDPARRGQRKFKLLFQQMRDNMKSDKDDDY